MPINKNAYKRFQIIHKYISSGKFPSADLLAEKCYISTDQVKLDIRNLRDEWNAPIVYNKKEEGYYYTDHTFYLPAIFVTEREMEALKIIVPFLKPLDGTEVYNTFVKFLRQLYELAEWEEDEILRDPEEIIDISGAFGDTVVLSKLINAARYLKMIKVTYKEGVEGKVIIVKPYKVVFEEMHFVLICEKDNELLLKIDVTTITDVEEQMEVFGAVDRIYSIRDVDTSTYKQILPDAHSNDLPMSKQEIASELKDDLSRFEIDKQMPPISYSYFRESKPTMKQQLLGLIQELDQKHMG